MDHPGLVPGDGPGGGDKARAGGSGFRGPDGTTPSALRKTRFFALLHVSDPHGPFRPTRDYEDAFTDQGEMNRLTELEGRVVPHIRHPVLRRHRAPSIEELSAAGVDPEEFVRHERNGYDGKIRGMDDAFARVMDGLDALGLRDTTLVAVVSDHGTEFLEHGGHSHGHSVYGELNRVPMLLWGPGRVPARGEIGATVQTIDLMPTLLELSGLSVPKAAQGRSLVSLIEAAGETSWRHPAITELPKRASTGRTDADMTSLVSDGWKLVVVHEAGGPRYELYDHRQDPLNLHDLSDQHPERVERLAEQVAHFRESVAAAQLDDSAATESMDAEELERLRSLGYVQ